MSCRAPGARLILYPPLGKSCRNPLPKPTQLKLPTTTALSAKLAFTPIRSSWRRRCRLSLVRDDVSDAAVHIHVTPFDRRRSWPKLSPGDVPSLSACHFDGTSRSGAPTGFATAVALLLFRKPEASTSQLSAGIVRISAFRAPRLMLT